MHPLIDTLLSGAATVLLQSTLILGLALGLGLSLRRNSNLRYAILCSALVITLLASVVAVWNPSRIRGIQVAPREREASHRVAAREQPDDQSRAPVINEVIPADLRHQIAESGFQFGRQSESAGSALVTPIPSPVRSNKDFPWRAVGLGFLAVWAAGSALLLIRLLLGLLAVKRLVRGAIPLPRDRAGQLWCETANAIKASGARHRPILVSARVSGPMVVGAFRPRILLPHAMLDDLPGPRLRAVLAHEIAHILRRDTLVGMLERWAQILLWPQPLLAILLRSLDRAREEVCDNYALAVADRREDPAASFSLSPRKPCHPANCSPCRLDCCRAGGASSAESLKS